MLYVLKISLNLLIRLIDSLILVRVLLSFFPSLMTSKIAYYIYQLTEPVMAPCRALLDRIGLNMGMIDFSPILAFLLLDLIRAMINSI